MEVVMALLPSIYEDKLKEYICVKMPDELRLTVGQPLQVRSGCEETSIWPVLSQNDLDLVLRAACRQSVYAYNETVRHGYITIEGGHRIGICGFGVVEKGEVQTIRTVSTVLIRIAKQFLGCADKLLPCISGSTLILGPPGSGKTTLMRDLVRQLSDKRKNRVALADERGELSAGSLGIPQLQVGARTDVMVNVPKADAAMMLLRTMNPQWIAMDEITSVEDISAMEQIAYCGVQVLATAHGKGIEDLTARPLYRKMMTRGIFHTIVVLQQDKTFTVQEI